MGNLVLDDILSGNSTSKINSNFTKIELAINEALSRVDSTDNAMNIDLDMNGKQIINLPAPVGNTSPIRLGDLPSGTTVNTAALTSIVDVNNSYTSATVEGALEELGIQSKDKVGSISDLISLDVTKYSYEDTVYVKSYHSGLNKGGGIFYWDSTRSKADHNGGTIIDPDIVFPIDWTNQTQLAAWFTAGAGTGVWVRKYDGAINVKWFGAIGDAVSNDSIPLFNFYNHLIASSDKGYINAGNYLVDLGYLIFDNGFIDSAFPVVYTDGFETTKFIASANTNAPFLTFSNGTASSSVGKFWYGGHHGGLTFERLTSTGTNIQALQNGLNLSGIQGTSFGEFVGINLGNDTIHMPQKLYLGNNPDPYHVAMCNFRYVEARSNKGYAFYNDNFLGLTHSKIEFIRATNSGGVFWGMGASNEIGAISAGSCAGWAIGDDVLATGGASLKFRLGTAEFDDCQYGIQMGRSRSSDFGLVRFVHRYNFSALNPSGGYWPRIALDVGSTSSVGCKGLVEHRIESGGLKTDLGIFADFNNSPGNISDFNFTINVQDNASFGFIDSDFYANYNNSNKVLYKANNPDRKILFSLTPEVSLARAPTTYAVPSGGFSGTQYVEFSTELFDGGDNFDPVTFLYTCPRRGIFRVKAKINLILAVGQRVRIGISQNGTIVDYKAIYAGTTNIEAYEIDSTIIGNAGDTIGIIADNNSGSPVNLSTTFSNDENKLSICTVD